MTPWQDRVFVIAEAGVNHNGSPDRAFKLVDAAAEVGCDAIKFQTFKAEALAVRTAERAEYQKTNIGGDESQFEMLKRLELPCDVQQALMHHAQQRGIQFFSTAFDLESIGFLDRLGIPFWKIPSGEITNYPYLVNIAAKGKPVLLSTGMATMAEIDDALRVLTDNGADRRKICILQCNTEYPTPCCDVNLNAMANLGRAFGTAYGYSDHTEGIEVAVAAVALGARVIEKHFTLDRSLPGPDHRASLEPPAFASMVVAVRNVALALGDGIKRPSPSEAKNRAIARKSLVAARPIAAGEAFSAENVAVKRPGTGLSPMRWNDVIGRRAPRDFAYDELIEI
jgi:N,N'-diacetyllegionaminate synthase